MSVNSSALLLGNLYFANIQMEDSLGGHAYMCLVDNKELRSLVQGDDQKIDPIPSAGMVVASIVGTL